MIVNDTTYLIKMMNSKKKKIIEILCIVSAFSLILILAKFSAPSADTTSADANPADAGVAVADQSAQPTIAVSSLGTEISVRNLLAAGRAKTYAPDELYEELSNLSGAKKIHMFGTEKELSKEATGKISKALDQLSDVGADASFVVMDLMTGEGFAAEEKKTYYSASSIKGPYVCAIASLEPEKVKAYENVITQTITVSSNSGYESLWMAFGSDDIKQWFKEAGVEYPDTREYYFDLTSVDLAKLWVRNWEFFESDEENADWVKNVFDRSYNSVINEELADKNTKVYSKPGWISDRWYGIVQNDAGVVVHKDADPYLIVVLSSAYGKKDQLHDFVDALDEAMMELE